MTTKECNAESTCLICASEYHMELILLPYLKKYKDSKTVIIFTEKDIEKTVNNILEKINIQQQIKDFFKKIDWSKNDENKLKDLERSQKNNEEVIIVINGMKKYKETIKRKVKYRNIEIIECFYLEDSEFDLKEIRRNTRIINTDLI